MYIRHETYQILYPANPVKLQTPDESVFIATFEAEPPYHSPTVHVQQNSSNPPPEYPFVKAVVYVNLHPFYSLGLFAKSTIQEVILQDEKLPDHREKDLQEIKKTLDGYIDYDLIDPKVRRYNYHQAYYAESLVRIAQAAVVAATALNQIALTRRLKKPIYSTGSVILGRRIYTTMR